MKARGGEGPQASGQVGNVNAAQHTQKVDVARQVDQVHKTDKAQLNKVNSAASDNKGVTTRAMDPVTQKSEVNKSSSLIMGMMSNMEKGQATIDKLISGGVSGKNFSNAELLSLQAGMYKYTQELELTGKVVEKATSGLKDTLKTQV